MGADQWDRGEAVFLKCRKAVIIKILYTFPGNRSVPLTATFIIIKGASNDSRYCFATCEGREG